MSDKKIEYACGLLMTETKIGKDRVAVTVDVRTKEVAVAFGLKGKPIKHSATRYGLSMRGAVDYIKRVTGSE